MHQKQICATISLEQIPISHSSYITSWYDRVSHSSYITSWYDRVQYSLRQVSMGQMLRVDIWRRPKCNNYPLRQRYSLSSDDFLHSCLHLHSKLQCKTIQQGIRTTSHHHNQHTFSNETRSRTAREALKLSRHSTVYRLRLECNIVSSQQFLPGFVV